MSKVGIIYWSSTGNTEAMADGSTPEHYCYFTHKLITPL